MIKFPESFFWGAATSAYQVEGNNLNADWWEWEKRVGQKEVSAQACRHYEFYKQDFDLAKLLNHNCHRFSLEWSRIEPEEGKFCEKELAHYQNVILALRERNLEPIVTFHHFTNPLWLAKIGGWLNIKASEYFLRYVKYVAEALSDKVNYWITINEPLVYIYHSYILGIWPPQEKSFLKAKKVRDNFILTHIKTHQLIHDIYQRKSLPHPKISIAQNLHAFIPCSPTLKNKLAVYLRDKFFNLDFLHKLVRHKSLDFIGVNYYTRNLVDVEKWGFKNLVFDVCRKNHHPLKKNSLGWDIYPEGLYNILLRLKKYNLPIMITENGICTQDDNERWNFINAHLKNIHRTMEAGVKVLGYIYWSLMDNFEWEKGFTPRFGLIDIDYQTYERTIRESAKKFASVCRTGKLD